jgi:hypothetical protein
MKFRVNAEALRQRLRKLRAVDPSVCIERPALNRAPRQFWRLSGVIGILRDRGAAID